MIADRTDNKSKTDHRAAIRVIAIAVVAMFVAAPILATITGAFSGDSPQGHLWSINAARYLSTTVALCALVGVSVAALGGGAAMITETVAKDTALKERQRSSRNAIDLVIR